MKETHQCHDFLNDYCSYEKFAIYMPKSSYLIPLFSMN